MLIGRSRVRVPEFTFDIEVQQEGKLFIASTIWDNDVVRGHGTNEKRAIEFLQNVIACKAMKKAIQTRIDG